MAFNCDKVTKAQMGIEMDDSIDKFTFHTFERSIPMWKTTHQRMAQCYDRHKKSKQIWQCLSNAQRTHRNAQGYLGSIVTEHLNDPALDCFKDSVGSTQALANEQYTNCIRNQIKVFKKVRNECVVA
eukprot:79203_1